PEDWEVAKLGDKKVSLLIKSGSTPSKKVKDYWNGNIPFVTQSDMTKVDHYLYETSEKITELGLKSSNLILVPENSVLLSMYGTIGKVVINKIPVAVSQNIAAIILNKKSISEEYLYYAIQVYSSQFRKWAKIITLKHLDIKIVKNSLIPLPSLPEQQKIAEILSTVDEAIQKTNEIIAKTERLKKGLMQELLTKGIGHKEFKDTEIGRIPKDWEVVRLGNIAEIIMGQSPPSRTYNREGKGLPFLQGKIEFGEIYPSPVLYCSQPIKIAEPNDILISVRAPVGDVNVAPFKLCIGRGLAAIRFNSQKAIYWFYFYYLQKIKNFLENLGKGSTFKAITKDDLENLKVPLPSYSEQQKIAEILLTIDKKLKIERNRKRKLERIKQGLMDLLLTGKIRVKVDYKNKEEMIKCH
ncbi:MAG: restriction endonuclease subunit S, partial [Nanopusillaceae archaeon]